MKPQYHKWIKDVVGECFFEKNTFNGKTRFMLRGCVGKTEDGEPYIQRCDFVAPLMAQRFPELKVVVGTYASDATKNIPMYHCWCVAPDGTIVDPTKAQFKNFDNSYPISEYYVAE